MPLMSGHSWVNAFQLYQPAYILHIQKLFRERHFTASGLISGGKTKNSVTISSTLSIQSRNKKDQDP